MSKFAVALEQPDHRNHAKFKYATAELAERHARAIVKGGLQSEMSIWREGERTQLIGRAHTRAALPEHVATVIRDALDRVWTQVSAAPGQRCFL